MKEEKQTMDNQRTWTVEYCPIPQQYLLYLWINGKAYTTFIPKEFAEALLQEGELSWSTN